MAQQPQTRSKAGLLYDVVVSTGNVDAIKTLFHQGASLEWIGGDGKTPLLAVCMNPNSLEAAKTLIQLGANLNAYRPGRHAGTPLHYAAREGLKEFVILLLSNGANAFVRNDDCQTPLDVARLSGHSVVVRLIENHICYFHGWFRQSYGPSFLEAVTQHLLTREIWVVVIPRAQNNATKPLKLELAVYSSFQDSQPSKIIQLWKARIEQPDPVHSDPTITIFYDSTKSRLKLAPVVRGDESQLQSFYNACCGISQVVPLPVQRNARTSVQSEELTISSTDMPLTPSPHKISEMSNTNGWEVSANNESYNGWGTAIATTHSEPSANGWMDNPVNVDYNGWTVPDSLPCNKSTSVAAVNDSPLSLAPSAPPIPEEELLAKWPIHRPLVDLGTEIYAQAINNEASTSNDTGKDGHLCVICWEAPTQGACVPCGHMAGCISCLTEIKGKEGLCPVCRSKIDQVVRLYAV